MTDQAYEVEDSAAAIFPPPARGWLLAGVPILGSLLLLLLRFGTEQLAYHWAVSHGEIVQYRQILSALSHLPQPEVLDGALIYIIGLLALVLLIPRRGPARLGVYLHRVRGALPMIGIAAGVSTAIAVIYLQALLEQNGIVTFHETVGERAYSAHSITELPLALALVAILAPIVEEIYFRGLLLGWLRTKLNVVYAVLISAVIFSVAHGYYIVHGGLEGWIITGCIAFLGVLLATLAIRTKSLWPAIAGHCGYNATLTMLPLLIGTFAS